jgi:hypothetical protein
MNGAGISRAGFVFGFDCYSSCPASCRASTPSFTAKTRMAGQAKLAQPA